MRVLNRAITFFLLLLMSVCCYAEEGPLEVFGYFQNSFNYSSEDSDFSSFTMQQLNLFLRKELSPRWTAMINFEVVNGFSSLRQWGNFSLEEAWVRWDYARTHSVTFGMQIPKYNKFNEIKNRTPLFPYIIRPLFYESSFSETIATEITIPQRAYLQAHGAFPLGQRKLEYAVFVGNSPNIITIADSGPSGYDSTTSYLIGGRFGLATGDFAAGISATHEEDNFLVPYAEWLNRDLDRFIKVPKVRIGGYLQYRLGPFDLDYEFSNLNYDFGDIPEDFEVYFHFATLSYQMFEEMSIYVNSMGWSEQTVRVVDDIADVNPNSDSIGVSSDESVIVYGGGAVYSVSERIKIKGQYARVGIDVSMLGTTDELNYDYLAAAISVVF